MIQKNEFRTLEEYIALASTKNLLSPEGSYCIGKPTPEALSRISNLLTLELGPYKIPIPFKNSLMKWLIPQRNLAQPNLKGLRWTTRKAAENYRNVCAHLDPSVSFGRIFRQDEIKKILNQ